MIFLILGFSGPVLFLHLYKMFRKFFLLSSKAADVCPHTSASVWLLKPSEIQSHPTNQTQQLITPPFHKFEPPLHGIKTFPAITGQQTSVHMIQCKEQEKNNPEKHLVYHGTDKFRIEASGVVWSRDLFHSFSLVPLANDLPCSLASFSHGFSHAGAFGLTSAHSPDHREET